MCLLSQLPSGDNIFEILKKSDYQFYIENVKRPKLDY